jgi:hypothetical protein
MNIQARTCANCANFNPEPWGDHPVCWNLASFTDRPGTPTEITRDPEPGDTCLEHQSHAESAAEDALLQACAELAGPLFASEQAEGMAATRLCLRKAAQL